MARGLEYADAARQAAHDALDWRGMAAEVAAVEAAVRRLAPPQAFSHNDLLSGNILVSTLVRLCNDRRRSQRYNGACTARLGQRMGIYASASQVVVQCCQPCTGGHLRSVVHLYT